MGISEELVGRYHDELRKMDENEVLRPGFVRVSLPFYASPATIDFVAKAVGFVATHGFKLLPLYTTDAASGEYRHVNARTPKRSWLGGISYESGKMAYDRVPNPPSSGEPDYEAILKTAEAHVRVAEGEFRRNGAASGDPVPPDAASLRWFLLPSEALTLLRGGMVGAVSSPFRPVGSPPPLDAPPPPSPCISLSPAVDSLGWVQPPKRLVNKALRAVLQYVRERGA